MGWFSDACSWVGSKISSAASTAVSAAKSAWNKTKEVAAKAVSWMADKAENFVSSVKETWKKVKPYVVALSPILKAAAAAVPIPWLKAAILIIDTTLQGLLALENSPVLKKIELAINWTIKAAKHFKEVVLTPVEIEEANERKATFDEASELLSESDRHALALAAMINDYVKIKSVIKMVFDNAPPTDFDHYLRLRATGKLLESVEVTLSAAQSVDDISSDDLFMLEIAAELIRKSPNLTDEKTIRLDEVIFKRFGQKLIPFVFEEMIAAWQLDLKTNQEEWIFLNNSFAKQKVQLRRLKMAKKISELSPEDESKLATLETLVKETEVAASELEKKNREMQNYVYAAEGFLQVLEKTGEELESDGRGYLAEVGSDVGMIIIDCAQYGKKWEALTPDEQSLIIDFANIFEDECRKRLIRVLEVGVGA